MAKRGWRQLTDIPAGQISYPIPAYSEFMPPPRLGCKAYGGHDSLIFQQNDPFGWHISEYEQVFELDPGLQQIAAQLLHALRRLGRCEPAHGISRQKLHGNPYWPADLCQAGAPAHERYVLLAPLALSRTQDDKGRVRWTLFGGSEQGPARAFWQGFYDQPGRERPAEWAHDFLRRLLASVHGEPAERLTDLRKAGFRIFETPSNELPYADEGPLPSWTKPLVWKKGQTLRGVKWLLTFCPYEYLPDAVKKAYRSGSLHLQPFPGSLVFWGADPYLGLAKQLPLATQIPLLHSIERHEAPQGIRVPQSGWLHEHRPGDADHQAVRGPLRNTYQRTHRWAKVHRHEDELSVTAEEDRVAHVLFSTAAEDLGLYGKPMARNSQIWTHDFQRLLDGPHADRGELAGAAHALAQGGTFGYRFYYPAMQVGSRQVFWHRPLVAYFGGDDQVQVLADAPLGYLTAYSAERPRPEKAVELWPRLLRRPEHVQAIASFGRDHDAQYHRTTNNIRKLLESSQAFSSPLERSFARSLLAASKHESLDDWLASLPGRAHDMRAGQAVAEQLQSVLQPAGGNSSDQARDTSALSYGRTARRSFEKAYWNLIARLATGRWVNKDNADCVHDVASQAQLGHTHRDLEALGDYLLGYYERIFAKHEMAGRAFAGELPFQWRTDFDFNWSGGWLNNQQRVTHERDLVVVIPGRDRKRAVIMADHYDTAYMEDVYGYTHGGGGPRLSAAGADDNHSATAALMLAAPILLDLSRAGRLDCDVWLVHLTGEEFPADCLGARTLTQRLVEGNLKIRLANKRWRDLSGTRIQGLYVLDMVAHNNDRDRDVFQICPGGSRQSLWLAYQAHRATQAWNVAAPGWNNRVDRRGRSRGRRSADGKTMPDIALHPQLSGEVRTVHDPRSTLYNTDGQIFSDAGVPVVLFMENYDINRHGYHDSHDTLENIDLDYGSAVAAIAIESVIRAATQPPLDPDG